MKRNYIHTAIGFVVFMLVGCATLASAKALVDYSVETPETDPCFGTVYVDNTQHEYDEAIIQYNNDRNTLAIEVSNYIKSVAPTAEIDPFMFIDLCSEYEIDLIFAMAQGQLESHFATRGTAARTKSIFNVGAYDGHSANRQCRNGFGYDNPNDSIEPYLQLIKNDYLVNNKTVQDLMNNYVNYLGMRYASNKKYESFMRSIYRRISLNASLIIAYENFLVSEAALNELV